MIIGLCGKAGSGKDYSAEIMRKLAIKDGKQNIAILSFAKPLYDMLAVLGLDISHYSKRENKENPTWINNEVSFRTMLQTLGTEWGRNTIDENLWVKIMRKKIDDLPENSLVIITDCRFQNEIDLIRDLNGKIIKVVGHNKDYATKTNHVSENEIMDYDILVYNDYTPEFNLVIEKAYYGIKPKTPVQVLNIKKGAFS